MRKQVPVDDRARAGNGHGSVHQIAPDLAFQRIAIVNVIFYGLPGAGPGKWVLIDAGLTGSAGRIVHGAEELFGAGTRPAAILLTHGHFDHVGALRDLAERWDVPVLAHPLELEFLDGRTAYPPPDPSVGGGLMSTFSRLYPRGPVDVSDWLHPVSSDGTIACMPGWRWIHTPGHTIGHVSFWREADDTLIAGDAFITTNQESAYAVVRQSPELHGPPMYFTTDWEGAENSVRRLAALQPELVITGHGRALQGPEMQVALQRLARDFSDIAIPEHGRYVSAGGR